MKRQLAAVTVGSDVVGVLCKMPHIFTDAEFADVLYVYSFCDGSATAAVKNTVDGFLCAEFRIVECFPRCSIHCVNVVRFPVLMFHLK